MQRQGWVKDYAIRRLLHGTKRYLSNGHLLELWGILPQKGRGESEGDGRSGGQNRSRPHAPERGVDAKSSGKPGGANGSQRMPESMVASLPEERLSLAGWIILLTHVPCRMLSLPEVLVIASLRWPDE